MNFPRLPVFLIAAAVCAALSLGAFAHSGRAADDLWQTDFKAAQAKAKQEKKYLLVDFTGSDWCPYCIQLHNEVFDKEPFKAEAPKQFVLVELDFPHEKELSDDLKKQNKEIADKYDVNALPTVLLLDAAGQVIARTGYREGGPDKYLEHLAELPKIYQNVAASKARLDKAQGLDRAKLLDTIVDGYGKLGKGSDKEAEKEVAAWSKEIIALDPDNKAGLKVKYEFPMMLAEASKLSQKGESAEAQETVDKALALKGVPAEMRQQGYLLKAQIFGSEKKFADLVTTLQSAKEAAPESRAVARIDLMLMQFGKVAEAQEAAEKLEAGLAKTEGAARAKLLDKLVDAEEKLARYDPDVRENINKWTKEIITLDADNKAGLKKKYQFKAALADAGDLMSAGKVDEADAALDKALETAGISGAAIQQAEFLKARIAFTQGHEAQGVAHLKKALQAAPEGDLAPTIRMMIRQFDRAKKPAEKNAAGE